MYLDFLSAIVSQNRLNPIMQRAKNDRSVLRALPVYNNVLPIRASENRFFAGPDRFLVCKTDSVCIKRIFFSQKKHTLRIIYWISQMSNR